MATSEDREGRREGGREGGRGGREREGGREEGRVRSCVDSVPALRLLWRNGDDDGTWPPRRIGREGGGEGGRVMFSVHNNLGREGMREGGREGA